MWLTLTTVILIPVPKKKNEFSTIVRPSRINMDKVNSYFEASENQRNHKSEDARFNTILDATLVNDNNTQYGITFCVKETVEEIDAMMNGSLKAVDDIDDTPTKPVDVKSVKSEDGWGKSGW